MKHLSTLKESVVNKDKDKELFDYNSYIKSAWNPIIKNAMDFQHINFDLENNESTNQKRIIYIKKKLRKDQPVKYQINAELCMAGGDWQNYVMYFKIQIKHQYGVINSKYYKNPEYVWDIEKKDYSGLSDCYVIIPPIEAGNKLVKYEKGWTAYDNSDCDKEKQKDIKITDEDKKTAWKWIEQLFEKIVDERHEMLDEPENVEKLESEPEPTEPAKPNQ